MHDIANYSKIKYLRSKRLKYFVNYTNYYKKSIIQKLQIILLSQNFIQPSYQNKFVNYIIEIKIKKMPRFAKPQKKISCYKTQTQNWNKPAKKEQIIINANQKQSNNQQIIQRQKKAKQFQFLMENQHLDQNFLKCDNNQMMTKMQFHLKQILKIFGKMKLILNAQKINKSKKLNHRASIKKINQKGKKWKTKNKKQAKIQKAQLKQINQKEKIVQQSDFSISSSLISDIQEDQKQSSIYKNSQSSQNSREQNEQKNEKQAEIFSQSSDMQIQKTQKKKNNVNYRKAKTKVNKVK